MFLMPFAAILTVYLLVSAGQFFEFSDRSLAVLIIMVVLVNSVMVDFGGRSLFRFQSAYYPIIDDMRGKKLFIISPVWAFFSGTAVYKDCKSVFRIDQEDSQNDFEKHPELAKELLQADFVWIYNDRLYLMHNEKGRNLALKRKDRKWLEFVSEIRPTSELKWLLFKVVK